MTVVGDCPDSDPITNAIVALFPDNGLRGAASTRFRNITRQFCVRNADAAGIEQMHALVEFTIAQYSAGNLLDPNGPNIPSRSQAVYDLIKLLYAYVGMETSFTIPAQAFIRASWDGAVGFAKPGTSLVLTASSGDFATQADPGFFVAPAVVVISRLPDATPFQQTYTEYPPRYQITVSPKEAQANYGKAVTDASPRAFTAVCPGEDAETENHPETAALRMLRYADPRDPVARPTEILPASEVAVPLLKCQPFADSPEGGFPELAQTNSQFERLTVAGRVAIRKAASSVASLLLPKVAYAWDGGVGGRSFEYSGFVAVDPGGSPTNGAALFEATFENEPSVDVPPTKPLIGAWTSFIPAGSQATIYVRTTGCSFDACAAGKFVELAQPAGLAQAPDLIGTIGGTVPTSGTYRVAFDATVKSPSVGYAYVTVGGGGGNGIGTVEFRPSATSPAACQTAGGGQITYNGAATVVGTWCQNQPTQVTLVVNLTTQKVSLTLNGQSVAGVQAANFGVASAPLSRIGFHMGGTAAQVVTYDNVLIAPFLAQ